MSRYSIEQIWCSQYLFTSKTELALENTPNMHYTSRHEPLTYYFDFRVVLNSYGCRPIICKQGFEKRLLCWSRFLCLQKRR